MTITILVFMFVLLIFQTRARIPFHICRDGYEASQYHIQVDGLPFRPRTFRQIPVLEDMSRDNDHAWLSTLMPQKEGFILVRHNETFELKMGISMFHALHCLSLVRAMLQDKLDGEGEHSHHTVHQSHARDDSSERFLHEKHVPHCLGYIAQVWIVLDGPYLPDDANGCGLSSPQSIICSGDDTIEPPWLSRDTAGHIAEQGVDGDGIEHQCRDTTLL